MSKNLAIVVRATDDTVLGWSVGAQQLTGYLEHEVLGQPIDVLLSPPSSHPPIPSLGTCVMTLRCKHGARIPIHWTRTPVHDEDGRLVAFSDLLRPLAEARAPNAEGCERGAAHLPSPGDVDVRTLRVEGLLRESEPWFRQVVDALPLLAWVCTLDGSCVFLSRRWATYTGRATESMFGWNWVELVHPDDRATMLARWRGAIADRTDVVEEFRLRRHDGEYRWFECRATVVRDASGRRLEWFGCNSDIHDARLAREALAQEREHLGRIIAAAPGAFFSYRKGADGSVTMPRSSPAIEHLLGDSGTALSLSSASLSRVHPDDRARVQESIDASERSMRPWRSEHRMITPHRGALWVEGHAAPVRDPDGATHWFGFLQDISERKRAEASLRTAQTQLVAALEAGGMGTSSWDIVNERMHLHESLLMLFGREADDDADDLLAFVIDDDHRRVRAALDALEASVGDVTFEYRVTSPSGELKWMSARGRSERDADGHIVRALLLHVDITQQKRATEIQLRSQKLEALGTLAGGIAHDFNNMLQAIGGNSALARRQLEPAHPARPLLDAITLASDRAADLVRRILQFSRPSEAHRDVLSLRSVVSEALKLVRATVPARIEIREELGPSDPHVEADATQIHQIVLNLAANASHAIGHGSGLLSVRLEVVTLDARADAPAISVSGDFAALHVADSGAGMSAETLGRIFDPFFTTKAIGEGTGLGLSVVHGIMKSLDGAITVRSAPGEGAAFTLYFPLARAASSAKSTPPPERKSARRGGRVLFLDDERILVQLGKHTLEALGYEVLAFESPREAVRAFADDPLGFDAVITDLAMPDLSGFDVAARLRALRADLPIIMLSGNVGAVELGAAQRLGLSDVLIKPVSLDALGRALERALRKRARRLVAAGE
ncbi:MAG: PAS domain-containing protein [Polyangiales bacterium]